jgi:predicted kinase
MVRSVPLLVALRERPLTEPKRLTRLLCIATYGTIPDELTFFYSVASPFTTRYSSVMPTVHLIEGPVGAGKSTFATVLASQTQGVHIALDEWFADLFSPDRPAGDFSLWYIARKERLIDHIWRHSQRLLASGNDVILELGLIQRGPRVEFCRKLQGCGYTPVIHVLDAPADVRRERVRRRNTEKGATFSMVVPDHVFDMASGLWEAPDEIERGEFEVKFVESPQLG